ncbi:MAG: hypothetical protein DRQ40_01970, partial [Gammaproteobacteria bacterium]
LARQLFAVEVLEPGAQAAYPLADDFDVPVFILPKVGAVPRNYIEPAGEEIVVPTFRLATACEWSLRFAREGRINIAERAMRNAARALVDYEEESAWRLLAPAATSEFQGKGLLPSRPAPITEITGGPAAGFFSKELLNQMIVKMKRTRRTLTDLYVSPEDMADQREWGESQVDPTTRREIFVSGGMGNIWGVNFHEVQQLGMSGRYNINSADSTGGLFRVGSGGSFNDYTPTDANKVDSNLNVIDAGETQIYGFDLTANDSLVMPIREELRMFDDSQNLHREQLQGFYGWQEIGLAVLDTRMIQMGVINRAP